MKILKRIFRKKRPYGPSQIFEDDIFVASYPKSGNTWLRFLLARLMAPSELTISFRNIDDFVPDLYRCRNFVDSVQKRPRFIKIHEPHIEDYGKAVYIYRDGRDVMISFYHYFKQSKKFEGSFTEFLRAVDDFWCGGWMNHVTSAINYAKKNPGMIFFIKYEDLLVEPGSWARQLAEFCRLPATPSEIEEAIQLTSFSELKKIESQFGPEELDQNNVEFFRAGKQKQWKEVFSSEQRALFERKAGPLLQQLGYEI